MKLEPIKFTSHIWLWQGEGAWHFVTVEEEEAELLKEQWVWPRKGFGSIPVQATIGKTTWKTSVFPEKKGTFLLPIKKAVRLAEHIAEGDKPMISLEVLN